MAADVANSFWEAMTAIEAQSMISVLKAQDFPHMKRHDRDKLFRDLHRLAYPHIKTTLTIETLSELING